MANVSQEVDIELLEKKSDGTYVKKNPATKANIVKFEDGSTVESHKADYEYQTPVLVGSQIQLVKQSNTKILKFKLDEDIPMGVALTISTNGGVSSKPLKDIEGLPVTELNKGFVEVIEDSVNFTYAPKGAKLEDVALFQGESLVYQGLTFSMTSDDNYIYLNGATKQTIWKLRKVDMVKVGESVSIASNLSFVTQDENYLYLYGNLDGWGVYKINKTNLSVESTPNTIIMSVNSIAVDNEYLYVGSNNNLVTKFNKVTFEKLASSSNYGGWVEGVVVDNDFVYIGGRVKGQVWRLNKSSLSISKTLQISDSTGIDNLKIQGDNLFGVSGAKEEIFKVDKTNMLQVAISSPIEGLRVISVNKNNVYASTVRTPFTIFKLDTLSLKKSNLNMKQGGYIRAMCVDKDHLYIGAYDESSTVKKYSNVLKSHYEYKDKKLIELEG